MSFESGDVLWRRRWTDVIPSIGRAMPHAPAAKRESRRPVGTEPSSRYRWALQRLLELERRLGLVERLAHVKEDDGPDRVAGRVVASNYYVGHPAIVERRGGRIWIVDATPHRGGIAITPYEEWLDDLPGCSLWHGRLRGFERDRRALVALAAASAKGRPYSLLNLHLDDIGGFYCSKLLWWAVWNSLGLAIDSKPIPARCRWLTPRETAMQPCFDRLFWPGEY
ncbi:MAG: hypothetical protein QM679_12300 [Patulibacter sp.]